MSEYRRWFVPGGCYFFTVVTHQRTTLFSEDSNINYLRGAIRSVMKTRPFEIDAIVILPDHLHCIWRLPEGDANFSSRWRDIKNLVSRRIDAPRNRRREKVVWQRRFWEHAIRDEQDWRHHMDYVHYNPVKHGYVRAPADWPHGSFAASVKKGWYPPDWGRSEPEEIRGWSME